MNINCDVIGDLLPLYAEDLVSQASKDMVEDHLMVCESCTDKLAHMREIVPVPAEEKLEMQNEAKPLKKFRFVLLAAVLGFPVWLPLTVAAFVIVLALYICVWAVVISLWCVPISVGAAALGSLVIGGAVLLNGGVGLTLFYCGCGIVCAGFAILFFLLMKAFTVCVVKGTVRIFRKMRRKKYA